MSGDSVSLQRLVLGGRSLGAPEPGHDEANEKHPRCENVPEKADEVAGECPLEEDADRVENLGTDREYGADDQDANDDTAERTETT